MQHIKRRHWLALSTAGLAVAIVATASPLAQSQERKSIRWSTSSVDSYGYKVAAAMVKVAEEALGGEYTITVNPYPATTAAMKAAMDGTGEIGYTADVGMTQLYAGEGGFKNYTPGKGKLVHTWYAYPMESFMAVPADKAAQFKCLKDLSGKPTFFTPAGFMNWLNFQRMYKALGYDFKHVQIDPKTQSDALKGGTIAGSVAYTTSGASLAPYWKETEVRMDVKVINPCPDEIAKLKAAGLTIADVSTEGVRKGCRRSEHPGRADPVRLQHARRHAGRRGLQAALRLLQESRCAREVGCGLHADGEGFRRHAGQRHQGQSRDSGACRPRQVPEGTQGVGRQVEDRDQRKLIG